MNARWGRRFVCLVLPALLAAWISSLAAAAPGFVTIDGRLPSAAQPYVMTNPKVGYNSFYIDLADLRFQATDPSQLAFPTQNTSGDWEFDSVFDVVYEAVVGFGLAPPYPVSGPGVAHVRGVAPGVPGPPYIDPLVYDTELLQLDLYGLSPIPEVYFRESPTLQSTGRTIVEDLCPLCLAPLTHYHIDSFFDVFTEISIDGGHTWYPASGPIHLVQVPEPASLVLVMLGGAVAGLAARKHPPRA